MLKVQVLIGALLLSGLVVLSGCTPDGTDSGNNTEKKEQNDCFGRVGRCDNSLDELKKYLH